MIQSITPILVIQKYKSESVVRQQELEYVKIQNQKIFNKIEEVETQKRAKFEDLFNFCNINYREQICIIANNDIIFDDTIYLLNKILEDNMIVALTRWEDRVSPSMEGRIGRDWSFYSHSQDVWAFRAGSLNIFKNDFCLGIPKCDNRLAFEAIKSGIKVINPAIDIKTFHHHQSKIRTWVAGDGYQGHSYFPRLTTIQKATSEGIINYNHHQFYYKQSKDSIMKKTISIEDFYASNAVEADFDEIFYESAYPETKNFYQPHCTDNSIDNRHRLFFHYAMYGTLSGLAKNFNSFLRDNMPTIDIYSLNKSIEDVWPVNKNFTKSYVEKTLAGEKIANESKIAVVALARNCEKNLQNSIDSIMSIRNKELRFFIYENDSTDKTKSILQYNKQINNIDISINTLNAAYFPLGIISERTHPLARYRNICKDWVQTNCENFDYVIVVDLDADFGFSIEGIYNSIAWLEILKDAGGLGSYSLLLKLTDEVKHHLHYDSFAVRLNDWEPTNNKDKNNTWFKEWHPLVGSDPVPLYSCFGGLAVYKTPAFLSGNYDGSIGCEHVLFHKSLRDKGYHMYLNPSSRFFAICDIDNNFLRWIK